MGAMREADTQKRLRTSLRLKAARYLAGGLSEDGKDGKRRAVPMPVDVLAQHETLVVNGITRNRLLEIEQLVTDARPMELERIAEALGVPAAFLTDDLTVTSVQRQLNDIAASVERMATRLEDTAIRERLEAYEDFPGLARRAQTEPPEQQPHRRGDRPRPSRRAGNSGSDP